MQYRLCVKSKYIPQNERVPLFLVLRIGFNICIVAEFRDDLVLVTMALSSMSLYDFNPALPTSNSIFAIQGF